MTRGIVLLELTGSPFGPALGAALARRGALVRRVALDAPLAGRPVTIAPGRIAWDGADLLAARALFVETPLFPWPQAPLAAREFPSLSPAAEREARALALSALLAAAARVRCVNPPAARHLAAAPALALDLLGAAGVPVAPWRIAPAPADEDAPDGWIVGDVAGRVRWHEPGRPAPGEPALLARPDGPLAELLVCGAGVVAARREGEPIEPSAVPAAVGALACRAARELELPVAEVVVACAPDGPCVLRLEAGPDLAAWDAASGGRVAEVLAGVLLADGEAR